MPASENEAPQPLSMRDLLASCAAATAVSTPPREQPQEDEAPVEERAEQRDAA
ncbi:MULTISPECIES: hypothetical protein [Streptomyces]|uniref:hypothetical protein n=1 Tax=Streptomyces TaxID=1883 RepID=UPI001BE5DFC3|nr:hypothetical protein [Streptomyces sp. ISL-99]MBT2524604.1 hypothetical protein [Streptomyces sp. ISL-99]